MADQQNNRKPTGDQDYEYEYFKDSEGKLQRIRKLKYTPRPGYIRLKFIEKIYIRFIRSSYDSKLTYLPWIVGLTIAAFIYHTALLWSQNDLNRQIKARLPFEFKNEQVTEVYRLLKENEKMEKRKKQEERHKQVV